MDGVWRANQQAARIVAIVQAYAGFAAGRVVGDFADGLAFAALDQPLQQHAGHIRELRKDTVQQRGKFVCFAAAGRQGSVVAVADGFVKVAPEQGFGGDDVHVGLLKLR